MKSMVVAKFGGTSVANIEAMKKSATIAKNEKATLVVVSATSGTTNKLIEVMNLAENGNKSKAMEVAREIVSKHEKMAEEINLKSENLHNIFNEIESMAEGFSLLREVTPKASDYFVGQGERISSILFHHTYEAILGSKVELIDARKFIKTDSVFGKGTPDLNAIKSACQELSSDKLYITQGFIASDMHGTPTILGRGGSDFSAALFAYGMGATDLQIWTDVSGMATVDPRLNSKARPISEISFEEAGELASFGAKVLHPRTLTPLWNSEARIFVKNTMDPTAFGTVIKKQTSHQPMVRGLAVKRNQRLITLTNPNMLNSYGFLAKVFTLFDQFHVSVDTIVTSEISVSLTLDESDALTPHLLEELEKICKVTTEAKLCLVSMIGNSMNQTKGVAADVFQTLKDFNIRMVNQGASAHNFCFMIQDHETEAVIGKLHQRFLE
jgi:aspartate kinase